MEWYYAVGDTQMGPVSEEEFKNLAASGTIRPETLVWNSTMDGWKPFREVTSSGALNPVKPAGTETSVPAAATATVVCRECGKLFKADEVVKIENSYVCGDCKPDFLQRLREGGYSSGQAMGDMSEEDVLAGDYDISIGDSLSASWELFQKNMGIMIGASILVYVALAGANMIPYLSLITGMLLSGPLMAGLWYFYILLNRGEEASVGDAFAGFSRNFWQLVLVNIVTSVISMICMVPMFLAMAAVFGFAFVLSQGGNAPPPSEFGPVGIVMILGGVILSMGAMLVLTTSWLYALPLVIDKGLAFWPAMELSRKMVFKHFWSTLLLVIVCGLLTTVGAMMCLVGILFTGPIAFGAFVWQYQRIFGNLRPES